MPRYVALFRGINVGKAKRIAMADLRGVLGELGYRDVATLLNSGNAVFTARTGQHAQRIRKAVAAKLGVDAHVIVKSAAQIAGIVSGNELQMLATDHSRLLVAMSDETRELAALRPLATRDWGAEKVHVSRQAAYLWCANGILESAAAGCLLDQLGARGTTRNWATMLKIHALLTGGGTDPGNSNGRSVRR